jgi:hypothetical protein
MNRALTLLVFCAVAASGCAGARLSHDEIRRQIADIGNSTLVPKSVEVRRVVSQSGDRAIAETTVELAFQFQRDTAASPWYISAVRLGDQDWVSLPDLVAAFNEGRRRQTAASLQKLAEGIASYRQRNGSSPAASNIVTLTDQLHPQYMTELIRLDAWGREIVYESGSDNSFRLRSLGIDGQRGTVDDILFPE